MKKLLTLLAFSLGAFAQTYTCPPYQNYNNAGACVFTSYFDSPGYLNQQNIQVANSLNSNPNGTAAIFAKAYGSLPNNIQQAIINCQVYVFDQGYFLTPIPSGANCPVSAPGVLDVATLVSTTPAPGNPGNGPSVTWDGTKFLPVVAPNPATPTLVPAPQPPAPGTNLVGSCFGNVCYPGPGAWVNATTSNVSDGVVYTQGGVNYTAHVVQGLIGISVYFTRN